jgi:hypothetical protein
MVMVEGGGGVWVCLSFHFYKQTWQIN